MMHADGITQWWVKTSFQYFFFIINSEHVVYVKPPIKKEENFNNNVFFFFMHIYIYTVLEHYNKYLYAISINLYYSGMHHPWGIHISPELDFPNSRTSWRLPGHSPKVHMLFSIIKHNSALIFCFARQMLLFLETYHLLQVKNNKWSNCYILIFSETQFF